MQALSKYLLAISLLCSLPGCSEPDKTSDAPDDVDTIEVPTPQSPVTHRPPADVASPPPPPPPPPPPQAVRDPGAIFEPDMPSAIIEEEALEAAPDPIGESVDEPAPVAVNDEAFYKIHVQAKGRMSYPDDGGFLLVTIGGPDIQVTPREGHVEDEVQVRRHAKYVRIKPRTDRPGINFTSSHGTDFDCLEVVDEGSTSTFSMEPTTWGEFNIIVDVGQHDASDCTDTGKGKPSKTLGITVQVDWLSAVYKAIVKIWEDFWAGIVSVTVVILVAVFRKTLLSILEKLGIKIADKQ